MNNLLTGIIVVIVVVVISSLSGVFYIVNQTEQVIITQFGAIKGAPITEPGLHMKIPFLHTVNRIDKRFLEWDGSPVGIPTKDKTYVYVDAFARWRISDPRQYFERIRDETRAQSRLGDILGSEIRNAVAKHELIEIVRSEIGRVPVGDDALLGENANSSIGTLRPITAGRQKVEGEIMTAAEGKLREFGIELLDVRLKRVNYNPEVLSRIYERMKSERQQIAQRFRSEGEGEAARILGRKDRDLNEIRSGAYLKVQKIRGEADAKASEIYAKSYQQNSQAAEFYRFLKGLETYKKIISTDSQLVISTDSELFSLLKGDRPGR